MESAHRNLLSLFVLFLLLVVGMGWLLVAFPLLATELVGGRNIILTIVATFLLAPMWVAYGRLSVFDNIDDLDARYRALIASHVSRSRRSLLLIFVVLVPLLLLSYGSLAAAEKVDAIGQWIWVIAPVLSVVYFVLMLKIVGTIFAIEADRVMVSDLKRKEEARVKLIEQLQKDRKEFPIKADPHLAKYNSLMQLGNGHTSHPATSQ